MEKLKLKSEYKPGGDQPQAIEGLAEGVKAGMDHQVLLGVTGSGKTFSLANVIEKLQMPTLIVSHNKTLAAQLYQEFRDFFPENAVSYFVSYYDYYQPEAYIPQTDTYIEKDSDINEEIDKLRLTTTSNLLTRPDCIVVASVSCIYNLGSPLEYAKNSIELVAGQVIEREVVIRRLVELQYERVRDVLTRGSFRVVGEVIEVWPSNDERILRIIFKDKLIVEFEWVEPLDFSVIEVDEVEKKAVMIFATKHYIADPVTKSEAFAEIRRDLRERVKWFTDQGKILEAHRIEQKVNYDLEMIESLGFVKGIENYSRYFDGRKPGEPPFTLLDYMAENARRFGSGEFLTIVDESHITLPQVRGMYRGDEARKSTLIDYGFRLPASIDNRPLKFDEFQRRVPKVIYTSATPNDYEVSLSVDEGKRKNRPGVLEQLIRPTGLLEPEIEIRPIKGQVQNLVAEIVKRKQDGERVLAVTLTKRMAEDLAEYLANKKLVERKLGVKLKEAIKVAYIHADVDTLDRSDILDDLRRGEVDVVVGINLLREGLDLPEVSLVAILDADKEGFLRSKTSLIQTMGRAARHKAGRVILYADRKTGSMEAAMEEIERRRKIQDDYNKAHGIVPQGIVKPIREKLLQREKKEEKPKKLVAELENWGWSSVEQIVPEALTPKDRQKLTRGLKRAMKKAADNWDFEEAAKLRDMIEKLEK